MSVSIVWQIDAGTIEEAVRTQLGLDEDVAVWGAVYDEGSHVVGVVLDISEQDLDKIEINDLEWCQMEEGDLVQ